MSTPRQLEIAFGNEQGEAPRVAPEEIEWLVGLLRGRDWCRASLLEAETGVDDRKIRAIARAARPRVVSYPGSPGYKAWAGCTAAELQRCMAAFRSQRDDMDESYLLYYRAYHSGFRG